MAQKLVYAFSEAEVSEPKALLGGKGAGLAEMTRLGIPVPPGFTITTDACRWFYEHAGQHAEGLREQVDAGLGATETLVGMRFGDPSAPLLLSVRSGARVSMPGMMDTILNLGLNDQTVQGLAAKTNDRRFAFDAYRRLLTMYSDVVLGVNRERFEHALHDLKKQIGDPNLPDPEIPASALEELCRTYQRLVTDATGKPFPQDVREQLWGAIGAVFHSWMSKRAVTYRKMYGYPDDWGTAVNVQAMVFGNMGNDCATGVAFTRNPSTGEKKVYGEFLRNAQGEDVVAGIRTPKPLAAQSAAPGKEGESLERVMPETYLELTRVFARLESHFRDVQDIEFTIQQGKLWLLQTRNGKRTARAAVRIAVDMVAEKLISAEEAVLRVDAASVEQLLHPRVPEPERLAREGIVPLAHGLPASPGAAMGAIVFDADEAEKAAKDGHAVILVRSETSPEDIHGMKAAKGILTATGGMTSHAAVVARGMGKPCVAGSSDVYVDYRLQRMVVRASAPGAAEVVLKKGDVITIDGTHGKVYRGEVPVEPAAAVEGFDEFMKWVDGARRLRVRANADTPKGARDARAFGAEGIGLCRTEHMFFAEDRLEAVRCMILAGTPEARARWIAKIEPMQKSDFVEIFRAMAGLPVTIRLLDWPLHEFMPRERGQLEAVARNLGEDVAAVERRAQALHEINPMLGHRGARLGVTHPEIFAAQARAIVEAAIEVRREKVEVRPEIMVPVVGLAQEIAKLRQVVSETVAAVCARVGESIEVPIGTMIELPRACLVADEIAKHAEFFSFGTNDLTQTTFGISRDDAGHFLPAYMSDQVRMLAHDPFASLDPDGVGQLVKMACAKGRATRAGIKLGICGEHGGDPASIALCESYGLDYVSCSPFRVPIARIAAAQAALRARR